MLRTYDLLLLAKAPEEPFELAAALEALTQAGGRLDAEGRGEWRLPAGVVEVLPSREGAELRGLELRVPLKDTTDLLEATVRAVAELPGAAERRFVDPQRGELASPESLGSLVSEYLRLARHAGEYGAVSEALGLTTYAQELPSVSASSRVLLGLVAFFFALYVSWRVASAVMADADEAEAPVDAPAKVPGK